jgi:hypothetical protein
MGGFLGRYYGGGYAFGRAGPAAPPIPNSHKQAHRYRTPLPPCFGMTIWRNFAKKRIKRAAAKCKSYPSLSVMLLRRAAIGTYFSFNHRF